METPNPQSIHVNDAELGKIKEKLTSVFRKYSNMLDEDSNNEKVVKAVELTN